MTSPDPPMGEYLADELFVIARNLREWSTREGGEHQAMAFIEQMLDRATDYQTWLRHNMKQRGINS
jgi:hypothetical protein